MNQPMPAVGESEVFWHLALRTDHLEKSLDAATNAGFEVTIPMRPLDLLNDVTGNRGRCAWPSFADPMVNRSNFWRTKLVTREAAMPTVRHRAADTHGSLHSMVPLMVPLVSPVSKFRHRSMVKLPLAP